MAIAVKKFILSLRVILSSVFLLAGIATAAMSNEVFFKLCAEGAPEEIAKAIEDGADLDAGELQITEISVKTEADWGDDEKTQEKEMTAPIPAAG